MPPPLAGINEPSGERAVLCARRRVARRFTLERDDGDRADEVCGLIEVAGRTQIVLAERAAPATCNPLRKFRCSIPRTQRGRGTRPKQSAGATDSRREAATAAAEDVSDESTARALGGTIEAACFRARTTGSRARFKG